MLAFADIICAAVPIGLFFGRVANFINGELWGRPTDMPGRGLSRRRPGAAPSERALRGGLEGIVLFIVLFALLRWPGSGERPGALSGVFLMGYACVRIFVEFFREPDAFLGFLWFGATMGQLLSIPVFLLGLWLYWRARPDT